MSWEEELINLYEKNSSQAGKIQYKHSRKTEKMKNSLCSPAAFPYYGDSPDSGDAQCRGRISGGGESGE